MKELEDRGIGRPSTYASIIGTILDRGYVFKKGTALVPTFIAFAVTQLLERHFGARRLRLHRADRRRSRRDRAGSGEPARLAEPLLPRRRRRGGLHALVTEHLDAIDARDVNSIEIPGAEGIVLRVGRYGPFLSAETSAPVCRTTSRPTSSRPRRRRSCSRSLRESASSAPIRDRTCGRRPRRALRPVCERGPRGGRARSRVPPRSSRP